MNNFEFESRVSATGYRWLTTKELGHKGAVKMSDGRAEHGPFLIEDRKFGEPAQSIARRPGTSNVLFREFAELDPGDLNALATFASANGMLFSNARAISYPVDWYESPDPTQLTDWLESKTIRQMSIDEVCKRGPFMMPIETHSEWVRGITRLHTAVRILDLLRARESKKLRQLFHSGSLADMLPPSAPESIRERSQHIPTWRLDTHPELADVDERPTRVRAIISQKHLDNSPYAPIESVALAYLASEVTARLDQQVSPVLAMGSDGKLFEALAPKSLYTLFWSQLFSAISEGLDQKKCPACGTWFEIGGREGATVRRTYCSDSCRVRACQLRKERVVELDSKGLSAKEVVETLRAEGHDTDVPTVNKWIAAAKKNG